MFDNEKELIERIAEGDELSFKQFFYSHSSSLQHAILRLTGDDSLTQEIIQETFINIWLSRDRLPGIENISGYLYRTAVNFFVMHLRKQVAERKREKFWDSHQNTATPTEYFKVLELKEIVANSINQLPVKRKEIFQLSRDNGMTVSQIANHLNIAESTVKNSISAALASIRRHLIDAGYESFISGLFIFFSFFSGE